MACLNKCGGVLKVEVRLGAKKSKPTFPLSSPITEIIVFSAYQVGENR